MSLSNEVLGYIHYAAFAVFALAAMGGALFLFFTKNILFGAYGLLVSLMSVAGLFILAQAEFIAVSQIMIYVGGVLILIIFGIMLSSGGKTRELALLVENVNNLWSLILSGVLMAGLSYLCYLLIPFQEAHDLVLVEDLGMSLMTSKVLLLEITGILLLVVLVGATRLAKKEEE